ncbi:hypothetical protein ABPG75_007739 [Micractinium tetrahymenae]
MRRMASFLRRRLPPADVIPLDSGYLVVRRNTQQQQQQQQQQRQRQRQRQPPGYVQGAARLPPGWAAAQERRYQRHLAHLHLLACARLALPEDASGALEQ